MPMQLLVYSNIAYKYIYIFKAAMKHKIKLYIILFFIQTLSCAFAQQMSVTTLPLNNYLPSSTILRVHCDREGFLWFRNKRRVVSL